MSHFTCLVIGDDIEAQLQPFHEFECTGTADQYVKDIDMLDEAKATFAEDTTTVLKATDGTVHRFFDAAGNWLPQFSQIDPDAPSFYRNRRTYFVPDGYERIDVPTSTVESMATWIEGYYGMKPLAHGTPIDLEGDHKYGYAQLNETGEVLKLIKRTNPNKRWDWWVIGGRWSGSFKLKEGATGVLGERGLMGSCRSDAPNRADQCIKGAIDIAGMRDDAGQEAADRWDKASAAANGLSWESWEKCRTEIHKGDIDAARDFYNGQAPVKAIKAVFDDLWLEPDTFQVPREQYIQAARDKAIATFAVLYKGEWTERGRMGWFGMSDDKVSQSDWNRLFNELIDGLPDDTLLTVVDCHI